MASGRVKFFKADAGYGFITPDSGGADVFVHIRDLRRSGMDRLRQDQLVTFETEPGKSGKGPRAVNVVAVQP